MKLSNRILAMLLQLSKERCRVHINETTEMHSRGKMAHKKTHG